MYMHASVSMRTYSFVCTYTHKDGVVLSPQATNRCVLATLQCSREKSRSAS